MRPSVLPVNVPRDYPSTGGDPLLSGEELRRVVRARCGSCASASGCAVPGGRPIWERSSRDDRAFLQIDDLPVPARNGVRMHHDSKRFQEVSNPIPSGLE